MRAFDAAKADKANALALEALCELDKRKDIKARRIQKNAWSSQGDSGGHPITNRRYVDLRRMIFGLLRKQRAHILRN